MTAPSLLLHFEEDAASAQPTLTGIAFTLNSTPSSTKASALLSVPGAMNCGTKARKKMATLGLSTLVQKPPRNTLRSGVCGAGAACAAASAALLPPSAPGLDSSMRTPIHIR